MKRSNWIHLDFWFKPKIIKILFHKYQIIYFNDKEKKELENYIRQILMKSKILIKRKFYLFEPRPHLFLALELKHKKNIKRIDSILLNLKKPKFIDMVYTNNYCGDDAGNGEGFLNILNAMTDFYLFHKDNKLSHIIHCCLEFQTYSRKNERNFYKLMLEKYK